MLENSFGHTWCNCLECDQVVEALRTLLVKRSNCDRNLEIAFVHFALTSDTTYFIFGEFYCINARRGEIQDPQLVKPDEDDEDWDEDDEEKQ